MLVHVVQSEFRYHLLLKVMITFIHKVIMNACCACVCTYCVCVYLCVVVCMFIRECFYVGMSGQRSFSSIIWVVCVSVSVCLVCACMFVHVCVCFI